MTTCALCVRTTSPENGVVDAVDAVLCALCTGSFEASVTFKRYTAFKNEGNLSAMRAALTDFVMCAQKEKQADRELAKHEAEKAEKEKAEAAKAKTEPAPKVEQAKPSALKN